MHLCGDRLYTEIDKNLNVYSMSDLTSPIANYPLGGRCYSALITDDHHLYLGGHFKLHVFEMTESLTQPLKPVKVIATKSLVSKMLRLGRQLLLG